MNKYERLFNDIRAQTDAGVLAWKQIRRSEHADIIYSPTTVFRQFAADYSRNGASYRLLLVEKKYNDDPLRDYAWKKDDVELLVLDHEGELVTTLTDSVIERGDLFRLAGTIRVSNDRVAKLFEADS
jgi:hypothetical protein